MKHDAMMIVRANLASRIDDISASLDRLTQRELCEQVDAIRHDAHLHGLAPLEQLASMLESALSMGGVGHIVRSYLEMMLDATGCETSDSRTVTTYLAALSLRVGY